MSRHSEYIVRPFQAEDAESMFGAVTASLPELCAWLPWCTPDYSIKDATGWVAFTIQAWSKRTEFPLGVFEKSTNTVVGGTGINHINAAHGIGNLGYWVSTPHTGKGIARFAAKEAARLAFNKLGITRLEIVTLTDNIPSQRVARSLRATEECIARNRLRLGESARDAFVFSLVPSDTALWQKESDA